jgi:hypothetical protein
LVERDTLGELPGIHENVVRNILEIAIQEGFLDIEAKRNDITSIFHGEFQRSLECKLLVEEGLLIVRQHEHKRNIEDLLQPAREFEGDGVAEMQTATARAAASVEEERLASLVSVEDALEVTMAEEQPSAHPPMRLPAGSLLEALEKGIVDE